MGDTVAACVAISGTVATPLKNYLVSLSVGGALATIDLEGAESIAAEAPPADH